MVMIFPLLRADGLSMNESLVVAEVNLISDGTSASGEVVISRKESKCWMTAYSITIR